MELNELKESIQEFFQENTVTIAGSGLSAAEDLPGMKDLAKYLLEEIPRQIHDQTDIDVWNGISAELEAGKGLEEASGIQQKPGRKSQACLKACWMEGLDQEGLCSRMQGGIWLHHC